LSLWAKLLLDLVTACCYVTACQTVFHTLSLLPKQLATFRAQESQCFCCTHNHVMPNTGQQLKCDRVLIYRKLHEWLNQCVRLTHLRTADEQEEILNHFNDFIQNEFASWVLPFAASTQLPYRYLLVACIPLLWAALDFSSSYGTMALPRLFKLVICEWCVVWLCVTPIICRVAFLLFTVTNQFEARRQCRTWIMTCVQVLGTMSAHVCMWTPLNLINSRSNSILPLLAWDMVLIILTVLMFRWTPFKQ